MAVIKDVIVVLHSVVVMLAVQYILQDHKLIECQTKYCNFVEKKDSSNSPWTAILSLKTDKEGSVVQCSCCKLTSRHLVFAIFTTLAVLHVLISIVAVLLKLKTFSLSRFLWVYLIFSTIAVINAFLITRLFSVSTPKPDVIKEGAVWRLVAAPFRFVWRTFTSLIRTGFTKLLIEPLSDWIGQDNTVDTSLYLCNMKNDSITWYNGEYGLAVLSWTYILASASNVYTLITCMSKERQRHLERREMQACSNNNCTDLANCGGKNAMKSRDISDSVANYSSDEDSFVLGWRL